MLCDGAKSEVTGCSVTDLTQNMKIQYANTAKVVYMQIVNCMIEIEQIGMDRHFKILRCNQVMRLTPCY